MFKYVMLLAAMVVFPTVCSAQHLRGINVADGTNPGEIAYWAFQDVNLVRHQILFDATMTDDEWLVDRVGRIRQVAKACNDFNVKYVLDFHSFLVRRGTDLCLTRQRDRFLNLWEKIIKRLKNSNTPVFAFELKSEPKGTAAEVNFFYHVAISRLRKITKKRIIVSPPYGNIDLIGTLFLPSEKRLIVNCHHYFPEAFTHQGIYFPEGATYPDKDRRTVGYAWTKKGIESRLKRLANFRSRNNVRILVGEFSSNVRYVKKGSDQWLRDSLELFEQFDLDYAYHVANEYGGPWDPTGDARLGLLRGYFQRNK